jgi:hypothetical protein
MNADALAGFYDSLRGRPGREAEAEAAQEKYNRASADQLRMADLMHHEMDRPSIGPGPAYELGKLSLDLEQERLARYWLNTALKRDPNHKPSHALLADLLEKAGDKEEAALHRRAAESKDGD